jgi:hypothetical protein
MPPIIRAVLPAFDLLAAAGGLSRQVIKMLSLLSIA